MGGVSITTEVCATCSELTLQVSWIDVPLRTGETARRRIDAFCANVLCLEHLLYLSDAHPLNRPGQHPGASRRRRCRGAPPGQ
jgi:NMD protein affecting ribosome stability and mRNA decay